MKRLLIALAAAVSVLTASARVTDAQSFEESFSDFEPSVEDVDESELVAYDNNGPDFAAPYDFDDFGLKYLSLDTGDATLWRTNTAVGNVYFDMALQFNPSASAPELGTENDPTKILLYQNTESNLVILAGPVSDNKPTSYVTTTKVTPGTWARVTVSSELGNDGYTFTVRLNGTALETAEEVASFPSLTTDTTITQVGFAGSGALDDFVARTTDPFIQNPVAMIGGEGYASFADALADDPTATVQLQANASCTIAARGGSVSVKLNGHTLDVTAPAGLYAYPTTSGDVTTYTADYFPRTATAGQDGTAANPYEIADADDLVALQEAILVDAATFSSKSYVQTANIDMTGVEGFYGIGWFASSTSFASVPSGVASNGKTDIPFAGTYDGRGYTNSNVTIVKHSYAGVFNNVSGTVKNLTVQDIDCSGTCSEWGCAIVGNAGNGSLLENLTAVTSTDFDWGSSANHNVAGIVVRPIGTATIRGCVNNAAITAEAKRVGGIAAFVGSGSTGTVFDSCTNYAALVSTDGTRGVGGILGCAEGGVKNAPTDNDTIIRNCADFGSETAGPGGNAAAIVGSNWNSTFTYTDDGGNTFKASTVDCCGVTNVVFGRAYALPVTIAEADYLTTVKQADLAAGNTYTLLQDVAASETPVFTLAAVGDTIAFNTNGYAFAGTVAAAGDMVDAIPSTLDAVITYTATEAPTVATITKNDVTTPYRTLQDAIAAAESGDTVNLVEDAAISGEVNIPANVTVVLASGVSLDNVTALSGTGVLFAPSGTVVPLVQTDHAASLLRDAEKWAGTLFIKNATMTGPDGLAYYGNANSTVRFDNVWVDKFTSSHAIGTLEVVGSGFYIQSPLTANMTLPCALVGDGPISLRDASATQRTVLFSGDVSAFTGNVTVATDTKSRIVFGTDAGTLGNDNCIVVDSGVSVTVAEGKTWTAPNGYVIKGTVTVSGTLAAGSEKVYGTGCVIYTSAAAAAASAPIAGSWTGTYVVGWAPTGAFNPNTYGNANSTVVLSNDLAASAYFGPGSATTLTISPTLRIAADVEIKNGYSKADDSCLVTFTKLTGDHKFSTSPGTGGTDANPTTRRYAITTLDNFTGSLKVKAGSELRIATVNVADGTNLSGLIIPAECDAKSTVEGAHTDGVITGALALTVAGVDSGKTLEWRAASGDDPAGLYVVASSGGFDGGDGATFSIPNETQSALAAKLPSGKTLADPVEGSASGMTYAQAYALGLMDEETGDVEDLNATIEIVDGKVKVSLDDATAGEAYTVTLKVYEKASLSADWPVEPKATYTLGNEGEGFTPGSGSATAGFYKVEVSVTNK